MSKPAFASVLVVLVAITHAQAAEPTVMDLWPSEPPGFQVEGGPERDTSGKDGRPVAGRPVIRLGFVSTPQVYVYQPPKEKRTGTAVVICPGGGFNILAWDLEGTEVAEWLNSLGITAIVLKYRAPTGKADPSWLPPAQDAQRALSLVRSRADQWGVDAEQVGILGFSAGGKTAAMAALADEKQLYEVTDEVDQSSCKADFAVLVYPAYLAKEDKLLPEVAVTKNAPAMFVAHAFDDPISVEGSLRLLLALKEAGVPSELHVYSNGGHGYGLRKTDLNVTTWPDRCAEWLKAQGLLQAKAE